MNRYVRRGILGLSAAVAAGVPFALAQPTSGYDVAIAVVVGIVYAVGVQSVPKTYADSLMSTAALAIPLWAIASVFAGGHITSQPEEIRKHFPILMEWISFGALFGIEIQVLYGFVLKRYGPENDRASSIEQPTKRVVILGGGFGGMKVAESLESEFSSDPSISIVLVNETNALLFTPMLAEVAGSSLEPSHISTPLRSTLHRTNFIRGRVTSVDLDRRKVFLSNIGLSGTASDQELEYDHLVLALGSVSNYLGMENVKKYAFNFKTLLDAIRIRNRVIEMFERADIEQDPETRKRLLTFVVAGGGFAGVELAGALNDFTHGILPDYRNVVAGELLVILVHSRDRILPELSETLAEYALSKMTERGVQFRLGARLVDFHSSIVVLSNGQLHAETLVWTAGTAPHPLVKSISAPTNSRGALLVETNLGVADRPGVWAVGDCASVIDGETGQPCPPTAQFALREAVTVARNIRCALRGLPSRPFHFRSLGALCVIGHQTACAELTIPFWRMPSLRFSGLFAWLLWRAVYLSKLPGFERKLRVLMAWTLELFFPRDVIQTIEM